MVELVPEGRLWTPRFVVLCMASLSYFMALGSTWPVVPAFVENDLGGGGVAVGLSMGAFGFSAALLRPLIGPLGDRRGRRLLLAIGSVAVCASLLLLIPANSVPMVVAARLVLGLGEAAFFIGISASVQDLAPPARRGEATSYFTVTLYAGMAVGPAIGEWLMDADGVDRAFLIAAVLALVPLALSRSAPGRPDNPPDVPLLRWRLHPDAIRPGIMLFIGLLSYSGFLAFLALHATDMGIDASSSVFTLFAVIVVATRIVGARIPDRLGALTTTRLSMGFTAAGMLLLGTWTSATGVYVGAAVTALGQCFLFPALFVLLIDRAPDSERSHAIGSFSVAFDLAIGIGGFIVGAVVGATDRPGGFVFCAVVAIVALALTGPVLGRIGTSARSGSTG
ncbi:MAG: MFS transporter [Actinomycetota bacterium]|nr:MFS transporter [Actinomycetota bacterium]MEC9394926.1 MFS transporter [Actinomycetota bacterium]MED6327415.1 MFS transporter [Actinomycetota bacterium]MEE2958882.1 MFS transporter [Actinomycetota bacterium]